MYLLSPADCERERAQLSLHSGTDMDVAIPRTMVHLQSESTVCSTLSQILRAQCC